ncbi:hypothetical protein DFH11DRAFT_652132 [Phellopilus nigrolimitatus]|nr:hypothetical protein DFH11DRAFT_652132 [Phellopilus nigrolimitatus]
MRCAACCAALHSCICLGVYVPLCAPAFKLMPGSLVSFFTTRRMHTTPGAHFKHQRFCFSDFYKRPSLSIYYSLLQSQRSAISLVIYQLDKSRHRCSKAYQLFAVSAISPPALQPTIHCAAFVCVSDQIGKTLPGAASVPRLITFCASPSNSNPSPRISLTLLSHSSSCTTSKDNGSKGLRTFLSLLKYDTPDNLRAEVMAMKRFLGLCVQVDVENYKPYKRSSLPNKEESHLPPCCSLFTSMSFGNSPVTAVHAQYPPSYCLDLNS